MDPIRTAMAKTLYDSMLKQGDEMSMFDLLALRSAFKSKTPFASLASRLQERFGKVAENVVVEAVRRGGK